jgi:pyruvate dehydrogenase E2 component (dihydrolipoamide acetyltransferase)
MALEVFMPRLTHEMQSGRLVEWLKGEGQVVRQGEPLFAVETDKATVDVEAEASGVLRGRQFQPGDEVPVGATMAWIDDSGEAASDQPAASAQPAPVVQPQPVPTPVASPSATAQAPRTAAAVEAAAHDAAGRVVASPLAKCLARELGVDLRQVRGRGPHGRITRADVQAFVDARARQQTAVPAAPPPSAAGVAEVPHEVAALSRWRQTVGERMSASWRTAPHFDLEVEVDMAEAARWRECLVSLGGSAGPYTAIFVCVVARALRHHPRLNAGFVDGRLELYGEVNMGVAMATPQGLMVPVIPRADEVRLGQVSEILAALRQKAQENRFAAEDVAGGTFTLSNLGMYGIDVFRAIINPPQAAILTVGRIAERPVGKDGQVMLRPTARLVLSVDHRVLDGAEAAPFLGEVRAILENPYLLL